ncbi:MAG: hypothetical protein IJP01_02605 [Oscillospiraceae bacterium]|nr:hypothetical protein [Oscillospiraceae bacterium]
MTQKSHENKPLTPRDFSLRQLAAALLAGTRQAVLFTAEKDAPLLAGRGDAAVFEMSCSQLPLDFMARLAAAGYDETRRCFFDTSAFSQAAINLSVVQMLLQEIFSHAASGSEAVVQLCGAPSHDGSAEAFIERDVMQRIAAKAGARIYVREQTAAGEMLLLVKK